MVCNIAMNKTIHTPDCDGNEEELFYTTDLNSHIDSKKFYYIKCNKCNLIRLDTVPENLSNYYPKEYYSFPSRKQIKKIASKNPFKIDLIKSFIGKGKLLEIGPAYGVFAFQAKNAGFDVDVIEMDKDCCKHLENVVGVNAICSMHPHQSIPKLSSYDVIALWHVIEHLQDPWKLMAAAAANLQPDGILVMAAPNPNAWQFRIMGKFWPHVDAPRHLYLLPSEVLKKYASSLGLECIHYSTTDSDAKSWNRFGWQRLFMNCVSNKWLSRLYFVIGYMFSYLTLPFENSGNRGSAYTIVFRKLKIDSGT